MEYSAKLEECRNQYPFEGWLEDYDEGIGYYSKENCLMVERIFDDLISALVSLGRSEEKSKKIDLFESAVRRLNLIRSKHPELIETMEREEFCELFDSIAISAGLDSLNDYGGDGIASRWREW